MSKDNRPPGIIRGTAIVGSMTLLSRILGFIRDLLFAKLFGAGHIADAFFVAFRIPNLLRSVMAEGALTSGFVPTFTGELRKGKREAQEAISQVAGFLIVTTTIITAVGIFWAYDITSLFAPGFSGDPEKLGLSSSLLEIMFPYIIFVSLVAMLGGALNSMKIYGTAALAQVVMNLVFIAGILLAMTESITVAPFVVAWSIVIGGMVQVLVQLPALRRTGFSILPSFRILTPVVRDVIKLMLPAIFGAAIYQLTIFLNTVFASLLGEGAVSALFYADRVAQLPLGIYSVALASVLLPILSNAASDKDEIGFQKNLSLSLRYTSFLILPVSALLWLCAEPLVTVLFLRGEFNSIDAARTALAVQAYAFGLWGMSCHTMIVRAFIARKDTVTPVIVGIIMLLLTILFSLIFIGPLQAGASDSLGSLIFSLQQIPFILDLANSFGLGHAGIALSSAVSSTLGFFIIALLLRKRRPDVSWRVVISTTVKCLISVGVGVGATLSIDQMVILPTLGELLVKGFVFSITYLIIAKILNISELQETFRLFRRLIDGRSRK